MALQLGQVAEGVDLAELAGVDEAHEHVADMGSVTGLVEQGVLAMQNGFLDGALTMPSWLPSFTRDRAL